MSVTRSENTADVVGPAILLCWNKKWWVIIPAVAAFVATFLVLKMVPEQYKVSAEIFVNRLSVPDQEGPSAGTVARLLENTEVLAQVRNDYVGVFEVEQVPAIEKWVQQFDVKTEILQDTSVRKDISPAITLTVQSQGSSETRYIMQSWLNRFVEHFGNYATEEAVMKRDAMQSAIASLETRIADVEKQAAAYEAAAPYHKKMLAERLDFLTPARLFLQDRESDGSVRVDLNLSTQRPRTGLLTRLAELQIDVDTGDAPSTASQAIAAYKKAISETNTSVTEAQNAFAEVRINQLRSSRHLGELTELKKQMMVTMNKFEVAATLYRKTNDGQLPAGGDIRALSSPVQPDKRIWPQRTVTAAAVAVGVAILATALLLAATYIGSLRPRPQ